LGRRGGLRLRVNKEKAQIATLGEWHGESCSRKACMRLGVYINHPTPWGTLLMSWWGASEETSRDVGNRIRLGLRQPWQCSASNSHSVTTCCV